MKVGIPKEIKDKENRVSMVPGGVQALVEKGHTVFVQKTAGNGAGFPDEQYEKAGATVLDTIADVYQAADMIVKVKEPQASEVELLKEDQILFTYLHLAPLPELTDGLLAKKVRGIAYETIRDQRGALPLLTPMSEVAGRMSVQVGAQYLQTFEGGRGVLLGGIPGVPPGEVIVIGGGVVGINAAKMALGLGARVSILDVNPARLAYLDDVFQGRVATVVSNPLQVEAAVKRADLLIGGVLIPGANAPKIIRRHHLKMMKPGSVIVDVAVDQGGCVETTKATTHSAPTFVVDGVVHYCVANMPGAVARTSTLGLTNVTLPYALKIADMGPEKALQTSSGFLQGANVWQGHITCQPVAEAQGKPWKDISELL